MTERVEIYHSEYLRGIHQRKDIRFRHFLLRWLPRLLPRVIWSAITPWLFLLEQFLRCIIRNLYSHPSQRFVEYNWISKNIDWSKKTILDFGAGDSLLPNYLRSRGFNVHILDLYRYEAQRGREIHFVRGDILYAPYSDNVFEQIIAVSVIEHIEKDQWCLQELLRILRPGGLLLITVPLGKDYYNREKLNRFAVEGCTLLNERYLYLDRKKWVKITKEQIGKKIHKGQDSFKGLACLVLRKESADKS